MPAARAASSREDPSSTSARASIRGAARAPRHRPASRRSSAAPSSSRVIATVMAPSADRPHRRSTASGATRLRARQHVRNSGRWYQVGDRGDVLRLQDQGLRAGGQPAPSPGAARAPAPGHGAGAALGGVHRHVGGRASALAGRKKAPAQRARKVARGRTSLFRRGLRRIQRLLPFLVPLPPLPPFLVPLPPPPAVPRPAPAPLERLAELMDGKRRGRLTLSERYRILYPIRKPACATAGSPPRTPERPWGARRGLAPDPARWCGRPW